MKPLVIGILVSFAGALLLFPSCTPAPKPDIDLDAPSHDYTVAAGTDAADAVRNSATAIAVAQKRCPKSSTEKLSYWRAALRGNDWEVAEVVVRHKFEEEAGSCISIDKHDGKPTSACLACFTVY